MHIVDPCNWCDCLKLCNSILVLTYDCCVTQPPTSLRDGNACCIRKAICWPNAKIAYKIPIYDCYSRTAFKWLFDILFITNSKLNMLDIILVLSGSDQHVHVVLDAFLIKHILPAHSNIIRGDKTPAIMLVRKLFSQSYSRLWHDYHIIDTDSQ